MRMLIILFAIFGLVPFLVPGSAIRNFRPKAKAAVDRVPLIANPSAPLPPPLPPPPPPPTLTPPRFHFPRAPTGPFLPGTTFHCTYSTTLVVMTLSSLSNPSNAPNIRSLLRAAFNIVMDTLGRYNNDPHLILANDGFFYLNEGGYRIYSRSVVPLPLVPMTWWILRNALAAMYQEMVTRGWWGEWTFQILDQGVVLSEGFVTMS